MPRIIVRWANWSKRQQMVKGVVLARGTVSAFFNLAQTTMQQVPVGRAAVWRQKPGHGLGYGWAVYASFNPIAKDVGTKPTLKAAKSAAAAAARRTLLR